MIAPIFAAFFCGVLATIIVVFEIGDWVDNRPVPRPKPKPHTDEPWHTVTSLRGSVDMTFRLPEETTMADLGVFLLHHAQSNFVEECGKQPVTIAPRGYTVTVKWDAVFVEAKPEDLPKDPP